MATLFTFVHDLFGKPDSTFPDHALGVQSTLIPAVLTTSTHFGASSARKAAKSCCEPPSGSLPSLRSATLMSSAASASLIALLSRATACGGVPAGPATPVHDSATTPGTPASAMVGSAGSSELRSLL